jgi:ATP-dependent exoDNAse (exonuclease V) alpha subunit
MEPSPTDAQLEILETLENTDANYFLSGQAGTGKSLVLREFVERTEKEVVVCAPTGLAAAHVDGVTIHSLFHLPVLDHFIDWQPMPHDETDKVLARVDAVVIDEASMVRADMLDAIDKRLQLAREESRPFGDTQIIMIGDLLQLPPVVTPDSRGPLQARYPGEYFYNADVCQVSEFTTIALTEVIRQSDPEFIAALKRARIGKIHPQDLALLNARVLGDDVAIEDLPTPVLATRNVTVNEHNERGLEALPGRPRTYYREWRGKDGAAAPADAPCERRIELKPGCPVLFVRNDVELGVNNGTTGVVVSVDEDEVSVETKFGELEVEPIKWPVHEYVFDEKSGGIELVELGEFLQLPLRLGFAMTVHRAQGQTYDQATVDFGEGRPFAPGQGYVAVSRVRSLEGLTLTKPLIASDFRASERTLEFLHASVRGREASAG